MRTLVLGLVASIAVIAGCTADGGAPLPPLTPGDPLPATTGSYLGRYQVPTSAELAAAATYPVDHVDWTVAAGVVTLHYQLPDGLVGGRIDVTFTGTLPSGGTVVDLAGAVGTGTCVATATTVTCREEFTDLGTLPISMAVVEQVAAMQYAGPVADRVAVAGVFSSDPIGLVEIDLQSPIVDDSGGGGGGP